MKKILIFTDKISLSGASKIVSWLANKLSKSEIEITLVTYLPIEDKRSINKNVKRIKLNVVEKIRILRSIIIIKNLRKIIQEEKFDLCIGFLPTECLYLQCAAIALRTKIIVCERSDPYFEKSIIANISRYFYCFADGAVFQTLEAKKYFSKGLQTKSVIIPNPAFCSNKKIIPYFERKNIISTSGRLFIRQKRQDILLKAFKKLCESDNKSILKIYGDGPDKEELNKLCKLLNISDRVFFEGNVKEVESLIGESKVFVLTSDYEGIPNVIIEAMQQGVPVVSTDCSPGGARVLIKNGVNGSLVPIRDVVSIATQIEKILNDFSIAKKYIENGLNIVNVFDEEKIFNMWNQYICSFLVGEKRNGIFK